MSDTAPTPSKRSSVRHTRAIQRDRSKRPSVAPPDEQVKARLAELIHPATYAQVDAYRAMGLRHRILTLPVMVAVVLSLIWRQLGSVSEAVRALKSEGMLWVEAFQVSQQAVSERLRTVPPVLFYRVLRAVLPQLHLRWQARQRPMPAALAWARERFTSVLALDGSTLDALLKKVGLWRAADETPLAGRMAGLLDIGSRVPKHVWDEEDSQAHDQRFWERVLAEVQAGALLIFDLGFLNFGVFDRLTEHGLCLLTRAKQNTVCQAERVLQKTAWLHDRIVRLGRGAKRCQHPLRLVEMLYSGQVVALFDQCARPGGLACRVCRCGVLATLAD